MPAVAARRGWPPQQPDPALVVPDDLGNFAHPGGPIIDDMLGREATVAFKLHHSLASRRPYQLLQALPRTRGPPPGMPLAQLGRSFYDELSAAVARQLRVLNGSRSPTRYSSGHLVAVALLHWLLVLVAVASGPSVLAGSALFVLVGLLPRSAEFAIHEALHFRVGRSARSNELAMLVSDLLLHIPAPVYRATHVQEHHVDVQPLLYVFLRSLKVSGCTGVHELGAERREDWRHRERSR